MSEKFNLEKRLESINLQEYKEKTIFDLTQCINICENTEGNQKTREYLEKMLRFVENVETLNLEDFGGCCDLLKGTLKENNLTRGNALASEIARLRDYTLVLVETHQALHKKLNSSES
jgi:hypothetical protein